VRARYSHRSTPIRLVTSAARRFRSLTAKLGVLDATAARIVPPVGIPLPPPCPVPAPCPTILLHPCRCQHSFPWRCAPLCRGLRHSAPIATDRGTQLHETEQALVTQPRQGPAPSQEPEILAGFCPAGETGVLGYGDAFVRYRRRLLRRKASRLRCRPCGNRFRVIELTCRLCCVHIRAQPLRVSPDCAALWIY